MDCWLMNHIPAYWYLRAWLCDRRKVTCPDCRRNKVDR
jgi:hypothetical protein